MLQSYCDGQIFGERLGTGQVEVVGLHGWARSRQDLLAALAGLDAVAPDLPGFGTSPEPSQAWGSQEYADAIAELIAELGRPQVLLGHSFGGRIAVTLASRRPDLVAGLVLTGVPLLRMPSNSTGPPAAYRLARWAHSRGIVSAKQMERMRQQHGSADYRNATGVMRSILVRLVNESYEGCLPQILCPVEMLWGEADTAATVDMAREACTMVKDCRLTVLDGVGHMTPLTAPQALGDAIRRLLQDGDE